MVMLKKDITTNTDEIFEKVIASGVPYYKYYAILDDNEEKYYVSTFEEAEKIINELKEKDSNNADQITYALKYNVESKDFSDTDSVVAALYVEKPKPVVYASSGGGNFNTMANVDYDYTPISINLIPPVGGLLTSRFGERSSRRSSVHTGLDIATSTGTPIKACAAGTVTFAGRKGSYGNMIVINHGGGVQTYYAHCSSLVVSVGEKVSQGQVIAKVGSTGNSSGPHCHLEVRVNGVAKNPYLYIY